ncbi:MAG: hypothetical protein CL840_13965 [Crocinitomicaceae bacterium]|nr:hypothetical protein [Crocinitomicaceae bacterium]|tara:strand:- start:17068 stop:18033 length:966 start_codon:yes stop_codon:yes gene_type:complete
MRFRFFLLLVLLMSFLGAYGHETASSSLELRKENETIQAYFRTPLNSEKTPGIFLEFPTSWGKLSENTSVNYSDKLVTYHYVFKATDPNQAITIIRTNADHSPLVVITILEAESQTKVLTSEITEWTPTFNSTGKLETFSNFSLLGIEHILIGFDHLLFVLALLFLVPRKQLIWAITSFTLAHSITLGISTFKLIELPIGAVEALIAFSIVLLAVEMTKPKDDQQGNNYLQLAFAFGLLHGFGFASVLSELGVPGNNIPIALLAFNVGVEIGQVFFVLVVLGFLYLFFKNVPRNIISTKLSYPIGGLAAFWFVERVFYIVY